MAARTVPSAREHILWALDTPAGQVSGNLVHEITHAFAFDIVPASVRSDVPGWLHEGLAEFARGEWVDGDVRLVREMLRMNTLPMPGALSDPPFLGASRVQTVVGHLAIEFLVERAGEASLKRMLLSLRESVGSPMNVYLSATGLSAGEFDRQFELYVRTRFTA